MSTPQVSIIVPVFNAEKYISFCIKSIIEDYYENREIILIDDGSTDKSGEICKFYETQYEFIKYYKQLNSGPSAARNYGLKQAKGKYIRFVDADDEVVKGSLADLVNIAEKKNCDLVVSSYICSKNNESTLTLCDNHFIEKFNRKDISLLFPDSQSFNVLWNKLFRRCEIVEPFSKKQRIGEDMKFVIDYLKNINSIIFLDKLTYKYNDNAGSITKRFDESIYSDLVLTKNNLIDFFGDEEWIYCSFFENVYDLINVLIKQKNMKGKKEIFLRILKNAEVSFAVDNVFSLKNKSLKIFKYMIRRKYYNLLFIYLKIKTFIRGNK